ncbi:MAG: response regulator [Candidatus Pacebacteria bacterium]|nr:response regulator [Candidatus Paceibacterota bacterium]
MKNNKVIVLGKKKGGFSPSPDSSKKALSSPSPKKKLAEDQTNFPVSGDGKKVLIVEDDDFLRGLLAHNMSNVGYSVKAVRNVEEGFNFMRRTIPDIILLDLVLPGMNGFDFLQEVKQKRKLSMPIIVLSNLGSRDDIDTAKSLGAMDFMIKANVAPAQIIDKVNEILSW